MKTEILLPTNINYAIQALIQNEVVGIPTETVYGLAGNATNELALAKIFEAKERPTFDPLIVHLSPEWNHTDILIEKGILNSQLDKLLDIKLVNTILSEFFPGPLTLLLPKGKIIPDLCTSGLPTVAIRIPTHPLTQELLSSLPFPLAAPSANRFGRISPTRAEHVQDELHGRIPYILDGGQCDIGLESTIIGPIIEMNESKNVQYSTHWGIYRYGGFDLELLKNNSITKSLTLHPFKKNQSIHQNTATVLQSPGLLDSHYAPRKPLILLKKGMTSEEFFKELLNHSPLRNIFYNFLSTKMNNQALKNCINLGLLSQFEKTTLEKISLNTEIPLKVTSIECLSSLKQKIEINPLIECAQNLFHKMRLLDENPSVDLIIADNNYPDLGLGYALTDRLYRAAHLRF